MQAADSRTVTTISVLVFLGGAFIISWAISLLSALREARGYSGWNEEVYLGQEGVVLQDKQNNCGPATLKMILEHHGLVVSLRELNRRTNLTANGSSLLALKEAAESFGLHAEGLLMKPEDLCHAALPAVLFVAGRHFVVLDSVDSGGHLYVRDPEIGRMKIPSQRLVDIWKGEALVFDEHSSAR